MNPSVGTSGKSGIDSAIGIQTRYPVSWHDILTAVRLKGGEPSGH